MNQTGLYLIGVALLVLALAPAFIFLFFKYVILKLKSKAILGELTVSKAFEIEAIKASWRNTDSVENWIQDRCSYKPFAWPVLLQVFFNFVCFSLVWDLLRLRFDPGCQLFYPDSLLNAAELPLMAFLGVWVFNLGHMLRRLYVWDITTHVYWNGIYRTWTVLAVAIVLAASMSLTGAPALKNLADWATHHAPFFAIGFLVNPVLLSLLNRAQGVLQVKRAQAVDLPLSLIVGVNFWHEYRLEEEGIENVQNLATCDLIDLAVTTRYTLRTLLDWVDQAILIHRMGNKALELRTDGFICGAIDMAWGSPLNSNGKTNLADLIAKTVKVESLYVQMLMNGLFQDTQVQTIWKLWQSDLAATTQNKPYLSNQE